MRETLLSIIIPVYNVQSYLRECLDSVYAQDLTGCEAICVNDGSTDNSPQILSDYSASLQSSHPTPLIIINRPNGGLSAARNTGLHAARGEFVYFLDSDDYLLPSVLQNLKHCNADITTFNCLKDDNTSYYPPQVKLDPCPGIEHCLQYYKQTGIFPPTPIWLNVYRRKFLAENNLIFKEGIYHEDEQFTPRALYLAQSVALHNVHILHHRTGREGAITFQLNEKNMRDLLIGGFDLYNFFKAHSCGEKLFYQKTFELFLSVANRTHNTLLFKKLFDSREFNVMKYCAVNQRLYLYYFLLRYKTNLFSWYITNGKPKSMQVVLNHVFSSYFNTFRRKKYLELR